MAAYPNHLPSLAKNAAPWQLLFACLNLLVVCHTTEAQQRETGLPSINPRYAYDTESVQRCANMNKQLAKLSEQIEHSSKQLEADIASFNEHSATLAKQQPALQERYQELEQRHQQAELKTLKLNKLHKQLEAKYPRASSLDSAEQQRSEKNDPQLINYNKEVKAHRKAIQTLEDQFLQHKRATRKFNQASAELKDQAESLNKRRKALNDEVFSYNKAIKLFNTQCQH